MDNVSMNGEDVVLNRNNSYFIIDGLYINTIRDSFFRLDKTNLEKEIREKVFAFPRTDTPFTTLHIPEGYTNDGSIIFSVSNIKTASETDEKNTCFNTDSGLIIFVDHKIFSEFVNDFDYEKLVDSTIDPINFNFWSFLFKKYNQNRIALILAPGIDSGYDFVGSGTYKIKD